MGKIAVHQLGAGLVCHRAIWYAEQEEIGQAEKEC